MLNIYVLFLRVLIFTMDKYVMRKMASSQEYAGKIFLKTRFVQNAVVAKVNLNQYADMNTSQGIFLWLVFNITSSKYIDSVSILKKVINQRGCDGRVNSLFSQA